MAGSASRRWGSRGSATATLIARALELGLLLGLIYGHKYELAASFKELTGWSRELLRRDIRPVLPVIVNEVGWAAGVSKYTVFYGMQGVGSTTTAQILEVITNLFFCAAFGLGSACGAMVGNRIGAGQDRVARIYAGRSVLPGGRAGRRDGRRPGGGGAALPVGSSGSGRGSSRPAGSRRSCSRRPCLCGWSTW